MNKKWKPSAFPAFGIRGAKGVVPIQYIVSQPINLLSLRKNHQSLLVNFNLSIT